MNRTRLSLLALFLATPSVTLLAQPAAPQPVAAAAPTAPAGPLPSALLAPAIEQVRSALAAIKPDKWKIPGPVAQETANNLASIQRDLDSTLPGLLATADRSPNSVPDALPAYRNIEALYDVLLRVTQVSALSAPQPQAAALQQATGALDDARRSFGDRLQTSAVTQTKTVATLQAQVHTLQTTPAPVAPAPVCPQPVAKPKPKTAAKPKPKPAPTTPTPPSQ